MASLRNFVKSGVEGYGTNAIFDVGGAMEDPSI
jgi:hypothetical protein